MLKPKVSMLRSTQVRTLVTERTRGGKWMRTIARIMRRANGLCECDDCKAQMAPRPAHQVDHIIELADGGADADHNLQALNADCHDRKTKAAAAARRAR